MSGRTPSSGFYASKNLNDVFAYSAPRHDAVWLKMGSFNLLDSRHEEPWPLPQKVTDLPAWLQRYGFERITTRDAQFAIDHYLWQVISLISPENNRDLTKDPANAIEFVRQVQDFVDALNGEGEEEL